MASWGRPVVSARRDKTTARTFLACIILAQGLCLAIGFWVQRRLSDASLAEKVEAQVWRRLESEAQTLRLTPASAKRDLAAERDVADPVGSSIHGADDHAEAILTSHTIVDRGLRVVAYDPRPGSVPAAPPGARLAWRSRRAAPDGSAWGELQLPDGTHLAVALAPDARGLRHLLHYPQALIQARVAELSESFTAVNALTLLWTLLIQALAVSLVFVRFHRSLTPATAPGSDRLRESLSLVRTRDAVIFGLAKLAESRDPETGEHLERISIYSRMLANAARRHPTFAKQITPAFIRNLGLCSALHDIGKVGIADHILRKPAQLTDAERQEMRQHALIGGKCLEEIEQRLGGSNFLQTAREIAFAHHERWDGAGYPLGIAGDAIPLAARIVAIADVYDALASKRQYKPSLPHDECMKIIREESGQQFDPELTEVWLGIGDRVKAIAIQSLGPAHGRPAGDSKLPDDDPDRLERAGMLSELPGLADEIADADVACTADSGGGA